MEEEKITISLQVRKDLYDFVKRKAYLEGTTVSYIVRKMLIDAKREEESEKSNGK